MKFKALHGVSIHVFFVILFLFLLSRLFSFPTPTEAFGERARKEFESDTRASSGLFFCLFGFSSARFGLVCSLTG
jgi:hypothetical protein